MSATDVAGRTVVRPAGLDYTPPSAEKYDWHTDIPADALDAKDFSSIDAWLDACIAQDRPGKIGSGTFHVDGLPRYAPEGIYGYGDTPPKFVADNVDCWLYLKDQPVTLKGLEFQGFGQVLGGVAELSDGHPHHATTKYGFDRFLTPEQGGTALELEVKASNHTVGPAVNISDCKFVNCENAFTFVSDTTQMGRIDFNNNTLTGTFGMLDVDSLYWTEVNAAGNEWANAVGDRAQPNVKQNGVQTGFKIGVDSSINMEGHSTKLAIVNNYAHDIQSVGTYLDTNAAVFADVRGVESANRGDNVISFNQIERLQGLKGQEDSNAIYAKAWGLVIQGNVIKDSGAAYLDADRNGSEASGVLVKPLYEGVARDIEVIGNTFVNMPGIPKGVSPDLAVVKISEAIGNSSVSFNNFIGGGNTSGSSSNGIVRWYNDFENLKVVGNSFQDIKLGAGDNAILFHQLEARGVGRIEVSNNSATKPGGNFDGDTRLVYFSGDHPKTLVTGHNTLEGGHVLELSRAGTGDAVRQVYVPPRVVIASDDDPTVEVKFRAALVENTGRETRLADISHAPGATISVDDPRFVVRDDGLYLRAGQSIDFEKTSALSLNLAVSNSGQVEKIAIVLPVVNVNEAPTAISVANLKGLTDTSARTMIADVRVSDPDGNSAFQANVVSVSDKRFEVADGHLYLKGGQSLDPGTKSVSVTLTATGAGGSVQKTVEIPVTQAGVETGWEQSSPYVRVVNGTGGRETIVGGAAAELLDGRDREDVMVGGRGDDTYVVSGFKDQIIEKSRGGVDTVLVSDNRYFLPDHVENIFAATSDVLFVGNDLANIVKGSDGDDVFIGGAGADLINMGAGADLVMMAPGDGDDVVLGFSGNDRLSIAGAQFSSFKDIQAALHQEGGDAVLELQDGGSVTLKGVQAASLTARQFDLLDLGRPAVTSDGSSNQTRGGTSASELIGGTAGDDYMDGKGGADVMQAGKGDDTYLVENTADRIVEASSEGIDLVLLRASRYELDAYVENILVKLQDGASVEGNALANRMLGGQGADTLYGGGGADVIVGGGGDDLLAGGRGVDKLTGGEGHDAFLYTHIGDIGDVITDFTPGEDKIDLTSLVDEMSASVSTRMVNGDLSVFLNHGGTSELVVTLKGVAALGSHDLTI
jgi:Ca2+-binding RTX toxin-like protein